MIRPVSQSLIVMKKLLLLLIIAAAARVPLTAQTQDTQNKFRLAQSFEQAGEYERASRIYENLVQGDSLNYPYFEGLRRCYEQMKNYRGAIALSLHRLKIQPNDINVSVPLGSIYYHAGDEKKADSVWEAAVRLNPRSIGTYTVIAMAQTEDRLFDKAIATYRIGRSTLGDPTLFAGELAMLYSLLLNYGEATREYLAILFQNRSQLELIESRLASFTSKEDGLNAATRVVEEAAAKENGDLEIHRLLLWLYMEAKHFDKAFEVARRIDAAIDANGAEMVSFADRAFKEKAIDVARKAYRFSIDQYPAMPSLPAAKFGYARATEELSAGAEMTDTTRAVFGLQPAESESGFRGAMALYVSLSREYPNSEISAQALYRAGLIEYKRFFDLDAATHVFDSLLTLPAARKLTPSILGTEGEINVAGGRLTEALQRYSGAASSPFATPSEITQARFRIAEIEYFQNKFDSATSALQQLSEKLSDDESNDALLLLHFIKENEDGYAEALKEYTRAELLERQKKYSEAISLFSDVVQKFSDAPLADDALVRKAELSTTIGQYADALAAYRKLGTDFPKSILRDRAQFGVGELYRTQLKDKESAIRAYEELLTSYPNSLFVDQARKRIRELRGDAVIQ